MNKTHWKSAYSNARANWRLTMNYLFPGERKLIAKVFDNRNPMRDRLVVRESRAIYFKEMGESAMASLRNEYLHAGKLDVTNVRKF